MKDRQEQGYNRRVERNNLKKNKKQRRKNRNKNEVSI